MSILEDVHRLSAFKVDLCNSGEKPSEVHPDYSVSSRMPQLQSFKFITARSTRFSEDHIFSPARRLGELDRPEASDLPSRSAYHGKVVFSSGQSASHGDCIQIPKIFTVRPGIASRKMRGDEVQLNSASTKGRSESIEAADLCLEACSPKLEGEHLAHSKEPGREGEHLESNISIGGSEGPNELPHFRIEAFSFKSDQRPRSATSLQEDSFKAERIDTNVDCDSLLRRNDHFVEFLQAKHSPVSRMKSPDNTPPATHPFSLATTKRHSKSVHEGINGFYLA